MTEQNGFDKYDDFARNFENDPFRRPTPPQTPAQTPTQSSGSYYSPRSAESAFRDGGDSPDIPTPPSSNNGYDPCAVPPQKHSSHKGLKIIGIFAAVALVSFTAIQCYNFAKENESLRKFFGHDESSVVGDEEPNENSVTTAANSSAVAAQTTITYSGEEKDWIELASREGAMKIPDIVDKVMPASVGISSTFVGKQQSYSFFGFGNNQTYERELSATGTGIIIREEGYIVTNAHVIYDNESQYKAGEAKKVQVVLNEECYKGETKFEAVIVGYDVAEDIAVLKIDTDQKLITAECGSSDDLRVGEMVVAIGNPLGFDLFGSVSTGIVSALNRQLTINDTTMRLIQTDTAINAGNSGGPLINSYGQVIGINSAKLSSSYYDEASVEGLCFAIPMSHAQSLINDLISFGRVRKPVIGITAMDIDESLSEALNMPMGVHVNDISEGGPADVAGIQKGDVIIAVNGKTITTYNELNTIKGDFKAGDKITLTVTRGGKDMDFDVILQENTAEDAA